MFARPRRKPTRPSEEKLRVLDALVDYPPYAPPIWSSDTQKFADATAKYRSYFLENRSWRIEALRIFLAKFGVALDLGDTGVEAVSKWCPIYANLLVDGLQHQESEELRRAYGWFQVPWTGSLIGLNPIFDLGVYMGECLLFRNPRLAWRPRTKAEPNKGAIHPIHGQGDGRPFDPIDWTYTECQNIHSAKSAKRIPSATSLYRNVQARANE